MRGQEHTFQGPGRLIPASSPPATLAPAAVFVGALAYPTIQNHLFGTGPVSSGSKAPVLYNGIGQGARLPQSGLPRTYD